MIIESEYLQQTSFLKAPKRKHRFNRQAMRILPYAAQQLFEQYGQGEIITPSHQAIHHAFEAHAAATPNATAVTHGDSAITYGDLNKQANRLAAILIENDVKAGDHVGLFLQRSIPMVVGILAILKVGAAYVPQHLGVAPKTHLQYVMATANIKTVLTLSHLQHLLPTENTRTPHILAIDEIMQRPLGRDHTPPPISTFNTCFVIFTSGTTGNPNGVQVTHANVCNILLTAPGNLHIRPGMRVAQILSIAFDMAAWEILGALGNGATLVIRGKDFMQTARQVDVIIATPSILGTLDADQCQNIQVVAVAGEPCPRPLADRWAKFCTFYNSCGPTETTIVNTAQQHHPANRLLTIGKPTPNNTVYILDAQMNPCPIGQIGEMWAGGSCVSAGYLGNPQLTAQRYHPDPFLGNGKTMFRTRDLGRWTANGQLEHHGRTDDQVKIRGFRVELDSVSTALESIESCVQAVTLKLNSRDLVAFVRPQSTHLPAAIQAVSEQLPYYCTPKFAISMDALPMTSRGKVDKRALMKMAKTYNQLLTQDNTIKAQSIYAEV